MAIRSQINLVSRKSHELKIQNNEFDDDNDDDDDE